MRTALISLRTDAMGNNMLETKRAKNMIWSAAADYSFEPRYIGIKPDGRADEYLNMVHGLVHKWLDYSVIDGLFSSFSGKNQELFEGLLWMGLEHAVYEKEKEFRPVLSEMRQRYAAENLELQRNVTFEKRLALLQNGYFRKIAGQPEGLPVFEEKLLHDFLFDGSMDAEQIAQKTNALLLQYFSWRPKTSKPKKAAALLHNRHAFRSLTRVHSGFIRITDTERREESTGLLRQIKMRTNYLFELSSPVLEKDTYAYLEACFGKSLLNDQESRLLDEQYCTGSHKNLHLFFTRGDRALPSGSEQTRQEIIRYRKKADAELLKNLDYDNENRSLHQSAAARLQHKIFNALNTAKPVPDDRARAGVINAGRIWRNVYCGDERIFTRPVLEPAFGFSVDILLDASSSRDNWQEMIASQGYILAQSLTGCGIPVQVSSFMSIRDYTVLRIFRSYHEPAQNRKIFQYTAGGNNRDGLALRGMAHLMEASPAPKKILILLTDASPNDDFRAGEGSRFKNREYADELAIQDTAREVRALRMQGISVLGVFLGLESSIKAAQQIFGKDFVRIQNISQFSDSVGNLLLTYLSAL